MSTATAPHQTRHPSRRGAAPVRRPSSRPPVRPAPVPVAHPARAPFVVLVLVLLSMGLGALLLLNTLLAQGSFTLHALDAKVADLTDREQALQQKAAVLAAPQRLARSASELGMVASVNPAFLRAEDGKVLGAPVPAASPPPVVVSEPDTNSRAGQGSDEKPESQDQQETQNTQNTQNKQSDTGNGGADR